MWAAFTRFQLHALSAFKMRSFSPSPRRDDGASLRRFELGGFFELGACRLLGGIERDARTLGGGDSRDSRRPPVIGRSKSSGKSSGRSLITYALSSTFSSCRTFPGQLCPDSFRKASRESVFLSRLIRAAKILKK